MKKHRWTDKNGCFCRRPSCVAQPTIDFEMDCERFWQYGRRFVSANGSLLGRNARAEHEDSKRDKYLVVTKRNAVLTTRSTRVAILSGGCIQTTVRVAAIKSSRFVEVLFAASDSHIHLVRSWITSLFITQKPSWSTKL